MKLLILLLFLTEIIIPSENCGPVIKIPIVINTWGFTNATIKAWDVLNLQEGSAVS